MTQKLASLSIVALLAGCAAPAPPASLSHPVPRTSLCAISDSTDPSRNTLLSDYKEELRYVNHTNGRPHLGLALSGGGTKAAMFSHGVLHGLHVAGILQHVDLISSVSGGGYASLWYYTKLLEESRKPSFMIDSLFNDCLPRYWTYPPKKNKDGEPDEEQLDLAMRRASQFDAGPRANFKRKVCESDTHWEEGDPYRFQAHLVRWPDVFGTTPVAHDGSPDGKPERQIRSGLFDGLFIEPLRQMFVSGSSVPELYQEGIERTWGLNPAARTSAASEIWNTNQGYTNARLIGTDPTLFRMDGNRMSWQALRKLHDDTLTNKSLPKVPIWIVNTNSGNKTNNKGANALNNFELTAFGSGAATVGYVNDIASPPIPDLATSVRAAAGFADAQGLTTWKQSVVKALSYVWPGARWGVEVNVPSLSKGTESKRLSDGGGSENLGLYSLLKRGVKEIIVVDTAEDIEGDMSDLCDVTAALASEQVSLQFDALEKFEDVCAGHKRYNLSAWPSPIVYGTAKWPIRPGETEPMTSKIYLIKAAWDQRAVADTYSNRRCGEPGQADCFLSVFYGHNSKVGVHGQNAGGKNMAFPQLPTAGSTANASSYLFWGYRELGRSIANHLDWNGSVNQITATCAIVAHERERKDRPE